MKLNKMLLMAAIAVGLVACDNKDEMPDPGKPGQGKAFAGMYISTVSKTRGQSLDYAGRGEEKNLERIQLLSTGTEKSWVKGTSPNPGEFWSTGTPEGVYTVDAWETAAGKHTMALLINNADITKPSITAAKDYQVGSAATAVADIAALSKENEFVMTSATAEKTIIEGVDKPTANASTSGVNENVFSFDVERVVAQGIVVKGAALTGTEVETTDGTGTIDLTTLKYAAVNGAVKSYLFLDKAGTHQMDGTDFLYGAFKSAIDGYLADPTANYASGQTATDPEVKANLVRLGNYKDDLGGYAHLPVEDNATNAKAKRGIYFLENSVDKGNFDKSENKKKGFYRLAYAKVYATFKPKKVLQWNGTTMVDVDVASDGTFWKGVKDLKLYYSKEDAGKSPLNPDQDAFKYTNGRCAYRALWNRQLKTDGKTIANADTRRNNIYLLEINSFKGVGIPWDSSDPDDPELPVPPGPNPPVDPDDPNIEKQDTYMRVEAKVLSWNTVDRQVDLD